MAEIGSANAAWAAVLPLTVTVRQNCAANTQRPFRAAAAAGLVVLAGAAFCVLVGNHDVTRNGQNFLGQREAYQTLNEDPLVAFLRGHTNSVPDVRDVDAGSHDHRLANVRQISQNQQTVQRAALHKAVTAENVVSELAKQDGEHNYASSNRHFEVFSSTNPLKAEDAERIVASLAKEDGYKEPQQEFSFSSAFVPQLQSVTPLKQSLEERDSSMVEQLGRADDDQGLTGFQPSEADLQRAVHSILSALDLSDVGGGLLKQALSGQKTALARYEDGEVSWGCREVGDGGMGGLAAVAGRLQGQLEDLQAEGFARADEGGSAEKRKRAAEEAASEQLLRRVAALRGVCQSTDTKNGGDASKNGDTAFIVGSHATQEQSSPSQQLRGAKNGGKVVGGSVGEEGKAERRAEGGSGSGIASVAAMITER